MAEPFEPLGPQERDRTARAVGELREILPC